MFEPGGAAFGGAGVAPGIGERALLLGDAGVARQRQDGGGDDDDGNRCEAGDTASHQPSL
jgi:hypothetical protein